MILDQKEEVRPNDWRGRAGVWEEKNSTTWEKKKGPVDKDRERRINLKEEDRWRLTKRKRGGGEGGQIGKKKKKGKEESTFRENKRRGMKGGRGKESALPF